MTELEQRLCAVELVAIELAALVDDDAIMSAWSAIEAGCAETITEEERVIRRQALQILIDGRQRFRLGTLGAWIRGGDDFPC